MNSTQFNLIYYKTNEVCIFIILEQSVVYLENLDNAFEIVFKKSHYECLFGKSKSIYEKTLIRIVNTNLKSTY
jgi:hypothetical protein